MTRFLTMTAAATLMATGVAAQSQVEISTIETFLPRVDVETLTDLEVTELLAIAHGGGTGSEKGLKMRAMLDDANFEPRTPLEIDVQTGLTEFERAEIRRYAPQLDVSTLTEIEIQSLQAAINNGDNAEIDTVVAQIMAN